MAEAPARPSAQAWTPAQPLVEVRGLRTWFPVRSGVINRVVGQVRAVDGVDLDIRQGETLGLVGESGCGKSTLGRSILRLVQPTAGEVRFKGRDILRIGSRSMRRMRREMSIIFQDPFASLDPRQTVADILGEALDIHRLARSTRARKERVSELLGLVGLSGDFAGRYPHEFSGGQRQRIGIARALAVDPSFIVCDEPISALDVSIQAQIINLLEQLQDKFHLTYLFIAHDLSVVKHISDRIAVMYVGKVVEVSPARDLYRQPKHPYTGSLLSAIPIPDPRLERRRERIILKGDVASPLNPPSGCRFRTRCFKAQPRCAETEPPLETVNLGDHKAACYYPLS
ncbi:MAG: ABC transporter ATP-binding protein [Chloroflexi bacterium]|nr:MAG: ABC transporter ATP-binding protein [Chloroflexota bacterium]TMD36401.1 MAG: ABC transporter ATP-binding protein [Chloroflexota bacterium]TMD73703.1 MAG: ABC transporter ATP-binding protein [Chloroflexota bacterium]